MINRMARLTRRLHDTLMRWAAVDVEYFYGGLAGDRLSFRAGMLEVTRDDVSGDGGVIESRRTDFLIPSTKLVINGRRRLPLEADVIRVPWNGIRRRTYEVGKVSTDSHFRPSDTGDNAWRVHTRMIAEE